ncbi:JmjC domain-containing protein [Streptomyces sp. NPDC056670]|uniref:JmjC domain-containing protein n=1 Tax=unclassified Streptomyces TaxID=2593676 RepID=UPI0036B7E611
MSWGVLDRLLGEPGPFLDTYRRGRPHLFTPPSLPQEVPTLRELTGALDGGLMRTPYVELVREGEVVPAVEFSTAVDAADGPGEAFADPDRIMRLLAEGATLLLPRLDRWNASVGALTALLSQDLGRVTEAFCLATMVGRRGPAVHEDDADVLVVQLAGRKEWTLYDAPAGRRGHPGPAPHPGAPALRAVVGAGDVLYVPRGTPHAATGNDGLSVHLALTLRETAEPDGGQVPRPRAETPLTETQLLNAARELIEASRTRADAAARGRLFARTPGPLPPPPREVPVDWPAAD